jgi:hypothetical protein
MDADGMAALSDIFEGVARLAARAERVTNMLLRFYSCLM